MEIAHRVDIFPWNNSFNTGVYEIDQQHKKLVQILNKVAGYMALESSHVDFDVLIDELIDYAIYHFETEDHFWLEKLPDTSHTSEHQESHHHFIQTINRLKANVNHYPEEVWIEELLSFLASWLASHILESDKRMALLVEAVREGMSPEVAARWVDLQMHDDAKATINVILTAYKSLAANTIRLMREIKAGAITFSKLSESEQRLQQAMDYAKIAHWSFPYKGNVANWSPQVYSLLGIPDSQVAGTKTLCSIMNDEFRQPFLSSMKRSFDTGLEHHIECQILRQADDKIRWIECRGKVIYGDDGEPCKISGFVQDITDRKEHEDKITQLAYYDSLTLLPNRRLLVDRLNQSIAMCDRNSFYNALLFIDIDNFKTVNDTHGHEYGDFLLQQAASRIRGCIRMGDTLARIGGDEFIIILSGMGVTEVEASIKSKTVSNKILKALASPYSINKHQFNSSASIGIILFNDSNVSASELMKQADISMYQAKQSGKNSVCFYNPQMHKDMTTRIRLEKELRTALQEQQFELFYQPQVDHLNHVIGGEVLIRWKHPKKGLINPERFIPIAEDTGLIIPIGEWVLEKSCEQLSHWMKDDRTKNLTLAVNVSYKQFCQPGFVAEVSLLIKRYHIDPGKLKIELTETLFVDNMEKTVSQVEALKRLGVLLSLDDFGTGYSSLQYLKRLPLSQLKIDRSFIDDLEDDLNDQSIVKTIILMARSLGLNVIAEGVETAEQKHYLEENGCFLYQGYFYSKPVPVCEFENYAISTEELVCDD
ncbi:EAL domain-containing protein [Vibrio salinus]|uniref:EAL domain-containing protein n=1 Tax=Vibrio salinus TaxID=2899784 RepID=UPI001E4FE31B|nr:EAL domain-containing protein [Vibrio salinus]MCE0492717.1 EAL domain-containing protein [Vibrio salinus]